MELPFNLQRLPSEALTLLRYMGTRDSVTAAEMEAGTKLSARMVGRAIRRLVNFDQIELVENAYRLTTDGRLSARQLAEYDAVMAASAGGQAAPKTHASIHRRLTVVLPRSLTVDAPTDLFISVNPPDPASPALPGPVHIELRLSAVNGTLSNPNLSLLVPPDKAATPARFVVRPAHAGRIMRVRVDVFQSLDSDHLELAPLGGMYFDVRVVSDPAVRDTTMRALGMDLYLRSPG